jgi:fibronectin type 3 domain-containing protein
MRKTVWYVLLSVFALVLTGIAFLRYSEPLPPRVTLTWNAPALRNGVTLVGYNVYRRTVDGDTFVKIADKVPASPYEDHLVTSGRKYVYVVTSVDSTGRESRFSADATVEIP